MGRKTDMFEMEIQFPKYANEHIRRKMLELAIELQYLAADGKLNNPERVQTLMDLLEKCAQVEGGDTDIGYCHASTLTAPRRVS